eukprot:COSAG02_NODE_1934_length_10318_cov_74.374009_8_plen_176_part_00
MALNRGHTARAAQAYVDNLKATGQCEDGCIIGLDGTAWTGGLAVTAEEGAAIVAGFDDASGLRASGIMIAGKKFMYLRNDEEMMCGKAGQGGICIFKTGQACIMGTYNQDMSPANNTKEVGKMAVRNAHTASAPDPTGGMLPPSLCLPLFLLARESVAPLTTRRAGWYVLNHRTT